MEVELPNAAEPARESRRFQFSLRSLILFVTVACIGLAYCANCPVDGKEYGTEWETYHSWLFGDWSIGHTTSHWVTRRPNTGDFATRLGLLSFVAVVCATLLREHRKERHSPLVIATICIELSLIFTVAWFHQLFLAFFDNGPILIELLQDREQLLIVSIWAAVVAVVLFPFTFLVFRKRRILRPNCFLAVIVLAEILVVTPRAPLLGLVGAFVAYALGLTIAIKSQSLPVELAPAARAGG